jgi:rhodanese-related sulfurtransferase
MAVLTAATAAAQRSPDTTGKACAIGHATTGERGQPTAEITTDQMEAAVAQVREGVLVLDARPYEEYAMSHVPGAIDVGPKQGLPMSQYTADVGEIEKLARGTKNKTIVLYCNGPFCGKSTRLASDLLMAGYTNVVRYQLGIPVWRALGHPTQAEGDAIWKTLDMDRTAVVIDAREPEAFGKGTLPGARNVRFAEVARAKDDGRLPMLDHNTRIFVVGKDAPEALAVAQEIARNAFHNVAFFAGSADSLIAMGAASGKPVTR